MIPKPTLMLTLLSALAGVVHAEPLSLTQQAAQVYFKSRPLSVVKHDLENNKLNLETQKLLVPLVIEKYKKQLDPHFSAQLKIHTDYVTSVAFSSGGRYALTGSYDNRACLWDLSTGKTIKILTGHTIMSVIVSQYGNYVVTRSIEGPIVTVLLLDLHTGQAGKKLQGHEGYLGVISSVALSQCGNYALTGSIGETTVLLWDLCTGQTVKKLEGHISEIKSTAFSPCGKYALTGSNDAARFWDLSTGKTRQILQVEWVTSVAFSPDGRYALTGSENGIAYLWDLDTGELIRVLTGHTLEITSVAISPDGRYALTGSDDNTARLWDLETGETGETINILKGHTQSVTSVAFSSDGRYALTGSLDNTARLWDLHYYTKHIDVHKLFSKINFFALEAPCTIV